MVCILVGVLLGLGTRASGWWLLWQQDFGGVGGWVGCLLLLAGRDVFLSWQTNTAPAALYPITGSLRLLQVSLQDWVMIWLRKEKEGF